MSIFVNILQCIFFTTFLCIDNEGGSGYDAFMLVRRGGQELRDFGLYLLMILVFLAFALTSPAFLSSGTVRIFLALPTYIQITMGLFVLCPVAAGLLLIIRFFSQDWAGSKIRYEERSMKDHQRSQEK